MQVNPSIFKDYDIRAVVDQELDLEGVERLGRALVKLFQPKVVAIGRDMRVSSDDWFEALARGITASGADVMDLGLIATDMTYYAAGTYDVDLAVMISASHNPPQYNGFKIVKKGAIGVSGDSGIYELRDLVISDTEFPDADQAGSITQKDCMADWIEHSLSIISKDAIKPYKVVVDAGNGMAGKVIPEVQSELPIEVIPLYFELDGTFPNHLANPLLEETHEFPRKALEEHQADLAIMFDGDGDRMFLLDEKGRFVSGTITTAMVANQMLKKKPGSMILYNAICGRVVPETVEANGGQSQRVRVGHTLIKEAMRKHDGLFAGEHSGHYYFKDNFYADSGLIAALVVLELMSETGKKLSELVDEFDVYPSSGEINFSVEDKAGMMALMEDQFDDAVSIDKLDGVSIWYETWWLNLRPSNTQPVLRLNVEADTPEILKEKVDQIIAIIEKNGGSIADEH